jgi:site-specific DNA recombinase
MSESHLILPARSRGVAYYRKSDNDDGSSVEQQREWAHKACPGAGIEIVREFADQAKKGWDTSKRTDFHAMLAFCQEQQRQGTPVDAVVCWHTNRFSRADSQETSWFIWEFRKAGVNRIFTASHGWRDFRKDTDRILFGIEQETTNHRYTIDLAQAATRGRIDAAKEGRPLSECPYGYAKEYEEVVVKGKRRRRPKRLVPGDPAEVEVVRWLFQTYAYTITSLRQLAGELNRRGVPTPGGAPAWNPQTIRNILYHPAYVGLPTWGRKHFGRFFRVVDDQPAPARTAAIVEKDPSQWIVGGERHEPLIDQETFDRVQARLRSNQRKTGPDPDRVRPLRGLVVCANCGHSMVGQDRTRRSRKGGAPVKYHRLVCCGYIHNGTSVCGQNGISEDALVDVLLRKLRDRFLDPAERERLRAEAERQARQGRDGREGDINQLRARVDELAAQIKRGARRLLTEDDRLLATLRDELRGMQDEHDRLARELAQLTDGAPGQQTDIEAVAERAADLVRRLPELRDQADPAALRNLLGEMVARMELHFEHRMHRGKKMTRFVRGVIHLRPEATPECQLVNCSRKRLLCRRARCRSAREPS